MNYISTSCNWLISNVSALLYSYLRSHFALLCSLGGRMRGFLLTVRASTENLTALNECEPATLRHLCLPSKFTRSFPLFTEKPALWRNVETSFFISHLKKPFNRNLPLSSFEWKAGIGGRNCMQSSPGRYFLSVCHASPSPSTIETSDRIKTTISFPQRKDCSL